MKLILLFLALWIPSAGAAVRGVFEKNCTVLAQPAYGSEVKCNKRRGDIASATKASNGFVQVRTDGCSGFVPLQCLAKAEASRSQRSNGELSSGNQKNGSRAKRLKLGLVTGFGGAWGKVAYATSLSKGFGYSLGVELKIPVNGNFRVIASPSFQTLKLGRAMDGSGSLSDPSPTTYDQSLSCLGITGLFGMLLEGDGGETDIFEPSWWLDGGFEFLLPLSAKQSSAGSGDLSFSADKMVFFLLGPSIEMGLSPVWGASGALQIFYNLTGKEQGKLFGLQARVALDYSL